MAPIFRGLDVLSEIFQMEAVYLVFHMTLGHVYREFPYDVVLYNRLLTDIHEVDSFISGKIM